MGPRPPEPVGPADAERLVAVIQAYPELIRAALLELLAVDIGDIISSFVEPDCG
jgi:hypothetical protein